MAAPKGNKFALGNTGGRPPHFETPKELQKAINRYFNKCKPTLDEEGKVIDLNPPTVSGLALFLGFESRQSLYDYQKRNKDFSYIIKRARLTIESHYEEGLNYMAPAGKIFALKNMGWSDKTEHELTGKDGHAIETVIKVELTDD